MKLLVLGIDGGTAEIFDAFDMPFWRQLRTGGTEFDITEDLSQRGWARMLSGLGAEQTGGLYMYPKLNADREFTTSFGFEDLRNSVEFKPIWEFATDHGMRAGMMNVPTTSPAQSIEGFYVSGGGGGIAQGGLPKDAVFPNSVIEELAKVGYIFDTRLGSESFSSPAQLCDHLNRMMEVRSACFSHLAKLHNIDFGFLVFRATTVLLYLAMSEIAVMLRHPVDDPRRKSWSTPWMELINLHMKKLDDCIADLFDRLQPENYILTSDHSMVPWTHNIDFNGFLAEVGSASFSSSIKTFARSMGKTVVKKNFRKQMADTAISKASRSLWTSGAALSRHSRAFSNHYVHGIYINDDVRFAGPVSSNILDTEVDEIVERFNWIAKIKHIPMTAVPYRRKFEGARHQNILPDIQVEQSGYAFPSRLGSNWYTVNPNFGPVSSLSGVKGMHSGQKGRHPLLLANSELARLRESTDPLDLRLVYTLTKRLFSKG